VASLRTMENERISLAPMARRTLWDAARLPFDRIRWYRESRRVSPVSDYARAGWEMPTRSSEAEAA
jgi:hypothetical protein